MTLPPIKTFRVAIVVCMVAGLVATGAPATSRSKPIKPGCFERVWGYRCFYGPIHVTYTSDQEITFVPTPPEAGYITSMAATLVDDYNAEVDHHAAHLHHIMWGNPNRSDLTCGDKPYFDQIDRFFAVGKERSKLEIPSGYGYHWDAQSPPGYPSAPPTWAMIHHLHSMVVGFETDVYVRFDLGFVPEGEAEMTDVTPVWLDVRNCTMSSEFNVERKATDDGVHEEVWNYMMPVGGSFLALGGHLHDGGLKLRLDNETTGEKVWVSRARYPRKPKTKSARWDLKKMSTYSGYPGKHVSAGDELELTAFYDDSRARIGAMGIMVGVLLRDP